MGCKKKSVLIGLAALCAALAFLLFLFRSEEPPPKMSLAEEVRTVRLANRVISVPCVATNQWTFPEASALSRRGTAPFVIVAKERVTAMERKRAAACGARVTGVIPPYGIVAEVSAAAVRRLQADGSFVAAEPLRTSDKMSDSLKQLVTAGGVGTVPVTMVPLAAEDAETVAASIEAAGGQPYEISVKGRGRVRANIPAREVAALAARGDVRWAERHVRPKLLNNVAVQPGLMNVTPVCDTYGLTGKGQTVTISDSGLDTGDPATVMADFTNRVAFIGTVDGCESKDSDGHGTHVAGSVAGDGSLSGGEIKGVAYEAMLNVWQCQGTDEYLYFPGYDSLFQPDLVHSPSYIHSGSWGGGYGGEYDSDCIDTDDWMWSHPENLAVFAAGNTGRTRSVNSPGGAKNVLTVGATESLRSDVEEETVADNPSQIAWFSSKGPMRDGRVKPDICAPGSYILSTRSTMTTNTAWGLYQENENYMYSAGTSMATPLVSGSAALVRQWLVERRGYTNEMPTAALMKAVLTGGAYDMSGDINAICDGAAPNSSQGWGRVDLGETLYPTNGLSVVLVDRIPFVTDYEHVMRITVTNDAPLAVQLVWTDYPGEYGAAQALVNDLDLVVSNETTGAVWYGNGVDGGDRTNSVESVRIANAPTGDYSVLVRSAFVAYDSFTGGAAALYVRGALSGDVEEMMTETVSLTVMAFGDVVGKTLPSVGSYEYPAGAVVNLSADAAVVATNSFGLVSVCVPVAGFMGFGSVPAMCLTNAVSVRLTRDSTIMWRWTDETNALLSSYMYLPLYSDYPVDYVDEWRPLGSAVRITVPESVPWGDAIDISNRGLSYRDYNRRSKYFSRILLGRIEVADSGEYGELIFDDNGHMATEFDFVMDGGKDIWYYYFDVASTNVSAKLPDWWYRRYAEYNPASTTVCFTAVSPKRVEWTGGYVLDRSLERSERLGSDAVWQEVYRCAPAPVFTNSWDVPAEFSTNSFYRISW